MIIVEDGTIVTGANAYVTVSGVDEYSTSYGYDATWSGTTDIVKEQALLKAMRYIDSLPFRGIRQTADQPLQFPRSDLYDDSDYLMDENYIPPRLINAVCEAAMLMLPSVDVDLQPNITRDGSFKSAESVEGVVSIAYSIGSGGFVDRSTIIEDMLREYLKNKLVVEIKRG